MTSPTAQYTDFSKDVIGRYVCNGLDEALRSTSGRPDAKPFDVVIVGGGSFGGAAAQHLLYSDTLSETIAFSFSKPGRFYLANTSRTCRQ
jgi:hypothetical protein